MQALSGKTSWFKPVEACDEAQRKPHQRRHNCSLHFTATGNIIYAANRWRNGKTFYLTVLLTMAKPLNNKLSLQSSSKCYAYLNIYFVT